MNGKQNLNQIQLNLLTQMRTVPVGYWTWDFARVVEDLAQNLSREHQDAVQIPKSQKRSAQRAVQEKNRRVKSLNLAKTLRVGDVVKMRGVRDGKGYRLILEVRDNDVVCRKLKLVNKVMFESECVWYMPFGKALVADEYITTHGKEKLHSILGHPLHRYRSSPVDYTS